MAGLMFRSYLQPCLVVDCAEASVLLIVVLRFEVLEFGLRHELGGLMQKPLF